MLPWLASSANQKRPYQECISYFENTPNQLNVYRLYGRFDGNTVFILGGIQGDEPGGFLSADLYPNLVLDRGNLIVIPRANFHSIIKNSRGVNGDMNRRFDNKPPNDIDNPICSSIFMTAGVFTGKNILIKTTIQSDSVSRSSLTPMSISPVMTRYIWNRWPGRFLRGSTAGLTIPITICTS